MMANRLPIFGVIAAVILFLIYSSVFVVNEREQAIVLRFGEIVDVKTEPGIYFKAPFAIFEADNVQIIETASCASTSTTSASRFGRQVLRGRCLRRLSDQRRTTFRRRSRAASNSPNSG